MTRRRAAMLAAAAVALALTGCGGGTAAPPPPVASAAAAAPTSAEAAPTSAAAPPMEDGTDSPSPAVASTWDAQAKKLAGQSAVGAVTAYLRKDLDPEDWWTGLERRLSPTAAEDYKPGDKKAAMANIRGTKVTGDPKVTAGESPALAEAVVPTDAGNVTVLMSRAPDSTLDNPWLVEHFELPDS